MAGVEVINRECPGCGTSRLAFFSHVLDRMRVVCMRGDSPEEDAFVWRPDQPRHGDLEVVL